MKRIEQLKAQREELDKRIRQLIAEESKAQREADKRRKIILGGWLMKHRVQLVREIVANLEREQDKAAFADWQPESTEPQKTSTPAMAPAIAKQA